MIPGLVQSRAAAGKKVHLVDMYRAVSTADLPDGVHPNAAGYDKMAAAWFAALRSVPGSISFVPPVAGLLIAGEVVRELLGIS